MKHAPLFCGLTLILAGCQSTPPSVKVTNHLALFASPTAHPMVNPVSDTRAADGRPGPAYWQQRTDYEINATIDPDDRRVSATATLTYTNNSPMDLPYIWFELPMDAFRDTSRSSAIRHINTRFKASGSDMGFRGLAFTVGGNEIDPIISDTRAMIELPSAVRGGGGTVQIELAWSFKVPEGSNRVGVLEFEGDELYEIARWIPQPCVYDDVYGWNTLPYLGAGESYFEFGDFDVTISAPEGVTIAGGGEWVNPQQRLTAEQFARYEESLASDEPVWIITPDEAAVDADAEQEDAEQEDADRDGADSEGATSDRDEAAEQPEPTMVNWRYIANNVRTFAFVAGKSYAMDGAGVDVGDSRVRCLSVFPPRVSDLWHSTSTPAIRHALSFYSEFLGLDYPYPVMVNVFGVEGGTEYPMMIFCGSREPKKPEVPESPDEVVVNEDGTETTAGAEHEAAMESWEKRYERAQRGLFGVTDHEVLHAWFPMIVGNDERRDGWMDEGFNEFGNPYSLVAWEASQNDDAAEDQAGGSAESDGVTGQSGTAEFDASDANSVVRNISRYAFSRPVPPILTTADQSQAYGARGLNVYSKPAAGLITLREGVLGADRFDFAMRTYLNAWAFKHPRPGDFFRSMENASGEDLGWFWRGWFGSTDLMDFAVSSVKRVVPGSSGRGGGEPYWGITLKMVGDIPAPVSLRIEFAEGEQIVRQVPVEAWFGGREFTYRLKDDREPFSVLLDPERVLPDADRDDNRWVGRARSGAAASGS